MSPQDTNALVYLFCLLPAMAAVPALIIGLHVLNGWHGNGPYPSASSPLEQAEENDMDDLDDIEHLAHSLRP